MNRRKFLTGISLLALISSSPSLARFPRGSAGTPSGFNGGLTQGQSAEIQVSADFPFLNYFLSSGGVQGTDTFNNGQAIDPSWLASDGYPLGSAIQAHSVTGNVFWGVAIPPQSSYTGTNGNLCLIWTVTGAGGSDTVQWTIGLQGTTPVSGSLTSTGNGTFIYKFTPSYNTGQSFTFNQTLNGTAHVSSVALVFDGADLALWQSGQIYNTQYLNRLTLAGFGAYRFMDWSKVNDGNASTWASRKSVGYPIYGGDEYRAVLSAGVTSGNTGNDYTITIPGTYAWSGPNGNYAGAGPVDKMTMHMRFNADSTFVNSGVSITTATSRINWTATPLVNGDPICLYADSGGDPGGTNHMITYYVINKTTNDFQIALTPGGSAVTITSVGQNPGVTRLPTLNINGTGAVPIRSYLGDPFIRLNDMPVATYSGGAVQLWATLSYDATLNCWMMAGGTNNKFSAGLMNDVPPEICFALCKTLGMYPYFTIPPLALDPATDYVTSLATYCKSDSSSKASGGWMIPHFEPANEIWNGTPVTDYATGKAFVYWGSSGSLHDWYGKALSIMGQGAASVYGLGNLGTTYKVMCGVKTDDGLNPAGGGNNPRITTNAWTTAGTPTQSGYTVSAASGWTSGVLVATYISPSMRGAPAEYTNAWQYFQVNGGSVSSAPSGGSAAMTNLNNFVDTLGGTAAYANNAYVSARYSGYKTWAAGFSVNEMYAYEGGYSPDLMLGPGGSNDWNSPITGASNASQCVLTLATTNGGDLGNGVNGVSGNIAAIGMCLWINGVNGMTQLNTTTSFNGFGLAPLAVGSSTITVNNSLVLNQGIVFVSATPFSNSPLPTNILPNIPYFVVNPTSTTFQISATKGGTPITFTGPAGVTYRPSWWAGWMVTGVSGNSVTIDCNSSGFGTYTSGGQANYAGSMEMCNQFRVATLNFASDMQAQLKANYDNFIADGGSRPSQYQFAGVPGGSIWNCITPDTWGTPTQEFLMIQHYNGH